MAWMGRLADRALVGLGQAVVGPLVDALERVGPELRYEPRVFAGEGPLDGAGLALRSAHVARLLFGAAHHRPVAGGALSAAGAGAGDATIVFMGDVLSVPELGRTSIAPGLRRRLAAAERVVVNLEGTAGPGPPRASFAPFLTWAGIAQMARFARERDVAGWTSDVSAPALTAAFEGTAPLAVGLANNHAFDRGPGGLAETRRALAAAGILPFGYDAAGAPEDVVIAVGSRRVGVVSTTFGHNHAALRPAVASGFAAVPYRVDPPAFAARAARLRGQGADAVVAWLHWGYEHEHAPRPDMVATADALLAAGCDAVIGHHPHTFQAAVARPVGLAAYALGDCIGGDRTPWSRFGLALALRIGAGGVTGAEAIPLAQTPSWAGPAQTMLLSEAPAAEQALFARAHGWKLGGRGRCAGR